MLIDKIRKKCLDQFIQLDPSNHVYMTELESQLFKFCGQPQNMLQVQIYYRKYVQLIYNLKRYYSEITSKYSPSELIFINNSQDLNPKIKQELEETKVQNQKYKDIVNLKMDKEEKEEEEIPSSSYLRCAKCQNTKNISTVLRQLRSADEPATAFMTCNQCGHHWKMG
jgi:DNA-directed RNA polymerase subunit M/transcription elongation factor TFIIS